MLLLVRGAMLWSLVMVSYDFVNPLRSRIQRTS